MSKIKLDNTPMKIEDNRTIGETISDIRDLLIQIDTLTTIAHHELDVLRHKTTPPYKEPQFKYEDLGE